MSAEEKPMTRNETIFKKSNLEMERIGRMLFSSEDGKLLMDILHEMFYDGDILGKDANETHFKLGQREVVRFLRDLRTNAKEH